ncbi:hypothetical protein ITJ46_13865 [Rathayibacter sp. VKM Ac-2878]|nr:hypothetical protein [Rathayibacter sp. VKM Ac-2879]MBF4505023.1 hypothetical protein [Rathayibacter sp. VKM Ac-2878]
MDNDYNYPLDPINKLDLTGELSADSAERLVNNKSGYTIVPDGKGGITSSRPSATPIAPKSGCIRNSCTGGPSPQPAKISDAQVKSNLKDMGTVIGWIAIGAAIIALIPGAAPIAAPIAAITGGLSTLYTCMGVGVSTPTCRTALMFEAVGPFGGSMAAGARELRWDLTMLSGDVVQQF